jgi:microcystin-dependent protein
MPPPVPGTVVSSGAGVGPSGDQGVSGPIGIPGDAEVGSIKAYAAAAAPASWMLCDGSAISRTTYPQLFSLIGSTYGAGDGSTTFNLPDLRSKMIVGMGQGTGLTNRVLAATGGEENHQLTIAELASHTHNVANGPFMVYAGGSSGLGSGTLIQTQNATLAAGSNTPHNTMPPFLVITYIIKVSPTGGATAQAPIADSTQSGLLRKVSGSATDYVDGTNNCQPLGNIISTDAGNALVVGSDNRIKAGGPTSHYYDYDDFVAGVVTGTNAGATKLCMYNTSGAAGAVAGPYGGNLGAGRPGAIQLAPGTVANAYARMYTPSPIFLVNGTVIWRMLLTINNAAAGSATQHLFGLNSVVNGVILATGYYIVFYFLAASSVNWLWQVRSAAAVTSGDSGVVATRNVWFDLKIIASTTLVQFFINGVQVGGNITTNIPPAAQVLYPSLVMAASSDTANYTMFADSCEIDIDTGIAGKFSRSPL